MNRINLLNLYKAYNFIFLEAMIFGNSTQNLCCHYSISVSLTGFSELKETHCSQ